MRSCLDIRAVIAKLCFAFVMTVNCFQVTIVGRAGKNFNRHFIMLQFVPKDLQVVEVVKLNCDSEYLVSLVVNEDDQIVCLLISLKNCIISIDFDCFAVFFR